MRMLPIGNAESDELEEAEADALAVIIQGFSIATGLWRRERRVTSPTGPTTTDTVNDIQWYVARTADVTFSTAVAEETVAFEPFTWVAPGDPPLQEGDVMINQSDTRLRFRLQSSRYTGIDRTGTARQQ